MTKPVTILHARVVAGAGGGPDKTILRSAARIDREQYRMACAYLHPVGNSGIATLRSVAARFDMPMYTIPERGPIDLRSARLLHDLCKRLHVDIWHAHDYKTDILGQLIRRWHPMKLVTTMHGFTGETWRTRLYAKLSHRALRRYDRVLAVSPPLMRHAAEHGVHPDTLRHVPNGIDLQEFKRKQPREQAKHTIGLTNDEHALAIVGRFSIEKGIDRALRMFVTLHRQRPQTRLHLIGDGPQRSELEQLAKQLGLASHIHWWGWQRDTRPILEAMDTLLLPSRTEGLPNVILEAMALGLPIAATPVGAVPEVLQYGDCGVLLTGEAEAWGDQLLPLIDQSRVRDRLLADAWIRVNEQYAFAKRMQRVASIYDGLRTSEAPRPGQQIRM